MENSKKKKLEFRENVEKKRSKCKKLLLFKEVFELVRKGSCGSHILSLEE